MWDGKTGVDSSAPKNEVSRLLQNTSKFLLYYTLSYPRTTSILQIPLSVIYHTRHHTHLLWSWSCNRYHTVWHYFSLYFVYCFKIQLPALNEMPNSISLPHNEPGAHPRWGVCVCVCAELQPPKWKLKKCRFCRYDDITYFMWFNLQLKSVTEIRSCLVHWNFEKSN